MSHDVWSTSAPIAHFCGRSEQVHECLQRWISRWLRGPLEAPVRRASGARQPGVPGLHQGSWPRAHELDPMAHSHWVRQLAWQERHLQGWCHAKLLLCLCLQSCSFWAWVNNSRSACLDIEAVGKQRRIGFIPFFACEVCHLGTRGRRGLERKSAANPKVHAQHALFEVHVVRMRTRPRATPLVLASRSAVCFLQPSLFLLTYDWEIPKNNYCLIASSAKETLTVFTASGFLSHWNSGCLASGRILCSKRFVLFERDAERKLKHEAWRMPASLYSRKLPPIDSSDLRWLVTY